MQHFGTQYVFKKFLVTDIRIIAPIENSAILVFILLDARIKKNSGRRQMKVMTTLEDAKRYCPMNSKCRGDEQSGLFEDLDSGVCKLDHERCHFMMCSILENIMKVESP